MLKYFLGLCFTVLIFTSCKKVDSDFTSEPLSDYFPLQVGKYITYDLDSLVFLNFGQNFTDLTAIHYQAQDVVDAQITDNLGRPAFRIYRYLRKDSTQPWVPNNVFMAVPTRNSIEYIEDNLRFIKLSLPVKEGFSWNGNNYLPDNTFPSYQFSDRQFMSGWNYTYDSVAVPLTINNLVIDSTIKVNEIDEFDGQDPSLSSTQYAEKTFSMEKYGKGIGLIYREFLHWEYQSPQSISPGYTGFGVTMSIIDHN